MSLFTTILAGTAKQMCWPGWCFSGGREYVDCNVRE